MILEKMIILKIDITFFKLQRLGYSTNKKEMNISFLSYKYKIKISY